MGERGSPPSGKLAHGSTFASLNSLSQGFRPVAIRLLLLMLMLLNWATVPDSTERPGTEVSAVMAPIVFLPFALRYREEAIRRIRSALQSCTRCDYTLHLPIPAASPAATSFYLPCLNPMYGSMCLQP